MDESVPRETWWVVEHSELRSVLIRASRGEDPEMLLMELAANSDSETIDRSGED